MNQEVPTAKKGNKKHTTKSPSVAVPRFTPEGYFQEKKMTQQSDQDPLDDPVFRNAGSLDGRGITRSTAGPGAKTSYHERPSMDMAHLQPTQSSQNSAYPVRSSANAEVRHLRSGPGRKGDHQYHEYGAQLQYQLGLADVPKLVPGQ